MSKVKNATPAKPIRFLSITTKGGGGKSTINQQVAATWLLSRLGEANLIELDDQNQDSAWLSASSIKTEQIPVEGDAGFALMDVIQNFAGKSFAMDVGNQTAEQVISALGKMRQLENFDLIFVPVRDVGQDLLNATRTIDLIREAAPAAKIALVLNGLPRATQDPNDRRLNTFYGEVFSTAKTYNIPLLILPGIEGYGISRKLGMTLYEINENAGTLSDRFSDLGVAADRAGDGKAARNHMLMLNVISSATTAAGYIKKMHQQIDELVKVQADE